jgi:hypothetical protein
MCISLQQFDWIIFEGVAAFLAHLCELLPSLGVRRPSVKIFNNLL